MKYWRRKPPAAMRGAPSWTVTFGDLMSLLLTFFVMLFSISEVKQNKVYELINPDRRSCLIVFHNAKLAQIIHRMNYLRRSFEISWCPKIGVQVSAKMTVKIAVTYEKLSLDNCKPL